MCRFEKISLFLRFRFSTLSAYVRFRHIEIYIEILNQLIGKMFLGYFNLIPFELSSALFRQSRRQIVDFLFGLHIFSIKKEKENMISVGV